MPMYGHGVSSHLFLLARMCVCACMHVMCNCAKQGPVCIVVGSLLQLSQVGRWLVTPGWLLYGSSVNCSSGCTSVCVSSKPQDCKVIMAFIWGYHLSLTISVQSLTWCLIKISLKSLCVVLH